MPFLACLPLISADIPAVLALDQRCLGGLWTASGYQRELESDCSDLCVLVSAKTEASIKQRQCMSHPTDASAFAATDPTTSVTSQTSNTEAQKLRRQKTQQQKKHSLRLLGVGCLWAILEEAHITTLAIERDYQGQKLGLLLLTHLLTCGRNRGLTRATLEVRSSNQPALSLYQQFDFLEAGQRKRYYADGEDALILWRSGLQTAACLNQINHHRNRAMTYLRQQNYTVISPGIETN